MIIIYHYCIIYDNHEQTYYDLIPMNSRNNLSTFYNPLFDSFIITSEHTHTHTQTHVISDTTVINVGTHKYCQFKQN